MTDHVTADLREKEAADDRAESRWEAYEGKARELLADEMLKLKVMGRGIEMTLEMLADDLPAAIGPDWASFREACSRRDCDDIGNCIARAIDRVIADYIDREDGQARLEELINELDEDARNEQN